jgi:hypothetical protein
MHSASSSDSFCNRRRGERRNSPGLTACCRHGHKLYQQPIRDISSTGVYIVTEQPWPVGTSIDLTLQRFDLPSDCSDNEITIEAKAVRRGEDGLALSFVLPEGMDLRLWQSPLKDTADQTAPEDIFREFRTAGALAFLRRICPSGVEDASHLLRETLSNYRNESAVEISLKAEKMLAAEGVSDLHCDNPYLVLRILEDGSWSNEDLSRKLWAGLLASCCNVHSGDESNLTYIDLLSQLTAGQIRILAAACTKAPKGISGSGQLVAKPLVCSPRELTKIAGIHDLIKIDRDLVHLADLGLLAPRHKPFHFSVLDDTNIRPTSLGLELYARGNGRRSSVPAFDNFVTPTERIAASAQ